MSSAVFASKSALLGVVADAVPTVQVTWGAPGAVAERVCVWLDDTPQFGDEASLGQVSHREQFVLPIVVSVLDEGDDARAAELAAWTVAAPIENAVRLNPGLNGAAGVTAAVVTGKSTNSYGRPGNRVCEIVISVTVRSKT